jgi:hypothetical protein
MKLNEKQLTIIFLVIFVLLLIAASFFTHPPSLSISPEATPAVKRMTPLTPEDQVLAEKVLLGKIMPLSKEDQATAQKILYSKAPKPLSPQEEAARKKLLLGI